MPLTPGIRGCAEVLVSGMNTAAALGSGTLPVFSTPSMIALMEKTALNSIVPYLDETEGSVGTALTVKHTAATPIGMKVTCESELVEVDRKRLVFRLSVRDEAGPIGEGTHERFVIDNEKFMQKAEGKRLL